MIILIPDGEFTTVATGNVSIASKREELRKRVQASWDRNPRCRGHEREKTEGPLAWFLALHAGFGHAVRALTEPIPHSRWRRVWRICDACNKVWFSQVGPVEDLEEKYLDGSIHGSVTTR